MMLKAIIVEQLEADGTVRTFRMLPTNGEIVVALASEYEADRTGPFHFLDKTDNNRFDGGFANSTTRRLGESRFKQDGNTCHVEFGWEGIPAGNGMFSCYALSLPENAAVTEVDFKVNNLEREKISCTKYHDLKSNRYVIYVKLMSSDDILNFQLNCSYLLAPPGQPSLFPTIDPYNGQMVTIVPGTSMKETLSAFVNTSGKWVQENVRTITVDAVARIFKDYNGL